MGSAIRIHQELRKAFGPEQHDHPEFFLNISYEEQKKRLLKRIEGPAKNWKFSPSDLKERVYWKQYRKAYEDALNETSTAFAPWCVIPADHKMVSCALPIADVIVAKLKSLNLNIRL